MFLLFVAFFLVIWFFGSLHIFNVLNAVIFARDCCHKVYWNEFLHYHGLQAENISSFQLNEDLDFPNVELCGYVAIFCLLIV